MSQQTGFTDLGISFPLGGKQVAVHADLEQTARTTGQAVKDAETRAAARSDGRADQLEASVSQVDGRVSQAVEQMDTLATKEALAEAVTGEPLEVADVVVDAVLSTPGTVSSSRMSSIIGTRLAAVPRRLWVGDDLSYPRPDYLGPVDWYVSVPGGLPDEVREGDLVVEVYPSPLPWWQRVDLLAWWDPRLADVSGGQVLRVPDRAGIGADVTSTAEIAYGDSVAYDATGFNGTPGLVFDGTSCLATNPHNWTGTGPVTIFANAQNTGNASGVGVIFNGYTQLSMSLYFSGRNNGFAPGLRRGVSSGPGNAFASETPAGTEPRTLVGIMDGANSVIRMDGEQIAAGELATHNTNAFILGGRRNAQNNALEGVLGDVLIMRGRPSSEILAEAEQWLRTRGGWDS